MESQSDDDWNVTPAMVASEKTQVESQSDDDWDMTSPVTSSEKTQVKEQSDDDWDITPAVTTTEKTQVKEQSDDNWDVTPAMVASEKTQMESHSDDDWDVTPAVTTTEKTQVKEQSDNDWNEAPIVKAKKSTMESQSDDDWDVTPSKPKADTLPIITNKDPSTLHSKKEIPLPNTTNPSLLLPQLRPSRRRRQPRGRGNLKQQFSENQNVRIEPSKSDKVSNEDDWNTVLTLTSWDKHEQSSQTQPATVNDEAFTFFDFSSPVPVPEDTASSSNTDSEQDERVNTILQSIPDLSVFANEVFELEFY